jgi:peptidoglycan/xylan/chitin deacetylase (PgdA/CDA1 family)
MPAGSDAFERTTAPVALTNTMTAHPLARPSCVRLMLGLAFVAAGQAPVEARAAGCSKPLYLTFDTGHMGVAPLIAEALKRRQIKATFFLANEKTQTGGTSLDEQWAPWWRERAAQGHLFASHTFDHVYWRADRADGGFETEATSGPRAGQRIALSAGQYCAQLQASAQRFTAMTGQPMAPLFRAPGGKTSPALLGAARHCGWQHVGWSAAGFLGDELPSERYPNATLLAKALRDIRSGDVLLAHLGIWSRQDAWAPAVLEPLLDGLKQRGFCFETLASHPAYRATVAGGPAPTSPTTPP